MLGDLPAGYGYASFATPQERRVEQAAPPGWRYAVHRVVHGRVDAASVVLAARRDGGPVSYSCSCVNRALGVQLERVRLGKLEALTAPMKDGRRILVHERGEVLAFVILRRASQLRSLGAAILGRS